MLSKNTQATFWLLLGTFFWGATFVLVKEAIERIDLYLFLAYRFLIAGGLLLFFCFRKYSCISPETIFFGLLMSIPLAIGYIMQTVGLQYTSASKAGFITGLSVVFVPTLMAFIQKKLPSLKKVAAVLLALAGIAMLTITESLTLHKGDLWVLIGALGFSIHIVLVALYSHRFDAVQITCIQLLGVSFITYMFTIGKNPPAVGYELYVWGVILFCALLATVLVFLAQNYFQRYISPFKLTVIFAFEPIFAFAAGHVYLGEPITWKVVVGGLFIVAAMMVPEWNFVYRGRQK